jgi:hypothetical protein
MTTNLATIAREQWFEWLLRWETLKRCLYSISFWTAALLFASWLRAAGFGQVVLACFALWAVFSLLALYLQARLLLDLISFCFTKRLRFYPRLMAFGSAQTSAERTGIARALFPFVPRTLPSSTQIRTVALQRLLKPVVAVAIETSPIAPLAICASTVLAQISTSTHAEQAIQAVKAEVAAERAVYAFYVG